MSIWEYFLVEVIMLDTCVCFKLQNDIIKTSKTLKGLRKGYSFVSLYHLLTSIS